MSDEQTQNKQGSHMSRHRSLADSTEDGCSDTTNRPPPPPHQRHRIALVCDFFWPSLGGVENHIWSLSQQLVRRGHHVIIITHAYGQRHCRQGVRYLPGPLKVYYCPLALLPGGLGVTVPTFAVTVSLLRYIFLREAITVVHGHQATSTLASEALVCAATLGLRSVYTDHSLFGLSNDLASVALNRVLQASLATVDAAICVSHTCRDNFVLRTQWQEEDAAQPQRLQLPLSERVRVIANAVHPAQFTPLPARRRSQSQGNSNRQQHRIKVVVISRLVFRKGVDLLVGTIPAVCALHDHVDFIIGGDGPKMLDLQEMVERERLEERVTFLFAVPHEQVRDVLVQGDVFLNCSLTESFCIALLEAASCGLLVVSTNVGGVPEVLPADMILLAEPNIPSLVENLLRAIQRQQSENPVDPWLTHQRVRQMYSWRRVALETEQVYDRISRLQRPTVLDRLTIYRRQLGGGMTGFVVCYIALLIEMVYQFLEWQFPRSTIDRAPDLC